MKVLLAILGSLVVAVIVVVGIVFGLIHLTRKWSDA